MCNKNYYLWTAEIECQTMKCRLYNIIRKRKLQVVRHIMRRDGTENRTLTRKIEGKRSKGRQCIKCIDSFIHLTGNRSNVILQRTIDRSYSLKALPPNLETDKTPRKQANTFVHF